MSKAASKNPYRKAFAGTAACLVAVIAILGLAYSHGLAQDEPDTVTVTAYQAASDNLRQAVLADVQGQEGRDYNVLPRGRCVVFMSYSNGEYRPTVRHAVGRDIEAAWDEVDRQIKATIEDSLYHVESLKCDIVYETQEMRFEQLRDAIKNNYPGRCPYGVALDKQFDIALLEQECNAYRLYDKVTNNMLLSRTGSYLAAQSGQQLESMPDDVIAFRCDSWLYEVENMAITRLSSEDGNHGIRDFELSEDNLATMVATSGFYLVNNIDGAGKFLYAYWPQDVDDTLSYSMVRHIDALWALTQYYELTGDETAKDAIQRGVEYLSEYTIESDGAAYVRCTDADEAPDEIRMGGAGLLLTVLSEYERLFGDDCYRELLDSVARGVLNNIQPDGHITHVLSSDLSTKRDFWVQYYEGEVMIGLCHAYRLTGNPEYLDGAQRIAQYCLDNDHATIGDHWFVMAMDELTKILPDSAEYYEAGLLAVARQAEKLEILDEDPTKLEQLMGAFGLYTRALDNGIAIPGEFDVEIFGRQLKSQAKCLLNDYLFPEKAMYSPCMLDIIGSFYTEDADGWKIRIDLVQHHLDAYYRMYCNYDRLQELIGLT